MADLNPEEMREYIKLRKADKNQKLMDFMGKVLKFSSKPLRGGIHHPDSLVRNGYLYGMRGKPSNKPKARLF
jgi:hypothetical protein